MPFTCPKYASLGWHIHFPLLAFHSLPCSPALRTRLSLIGLRDVPCLPPSSPPPLSLFAPVSPQLLTSRPQLSSTRSPARACPSLPNSDILAASFRLPCSPVVPQYSQGSLQNFCFFSEQIHDNQQSVDEKKPHKSGVTDMISALCMRRTAEPDDEPPGILSGQAGLTGVPNLQKNQINV